MIATPISGNLNRNVSADTNDSNHSSSDSTNSFNNLENINSFIPSNITTPSILNLPQMPQNSINHNYNNSSTPQSFCSNINPYFSPSKNMDTNFNANAISNVNLTPCYDQNISAINTPLNNNNLNGITTNNASNNSNLIIDTPSTPANISLIYNNKPINYSDFNDLLNIPEYSDLTYNSNPNPNPNSNSNSNSIRPQFIQSHNRSCSFPTSLGSINNKQNSNLNSNSNRFSLPSIADDDQIDIENLESKLNSLSFDIQPSFSNTRRNTLFSNSSLYSNNSISTSISNVPSAPSSASCSSNSNPTINNNNNNNNNCNLLNLNISSLKPQLESSKSASSIQPQQYHNNLSSDDIDLSSLTSNDLLILSKDQHGCRMLQKKLDENSNNGNFELIFNLVYKFSSQLMLDPFGNYLIQKIILLSDSNQISKILIEITPTVNLIAINLHGTRALQKLIGCLTTYEHHELLRIAIAPHIVKLVHDLNGNHVIQKIILHYFDNDLNFLIELILINLIEISSHKHGCCILQKLLNKCSMNQVNLISNEILNNSNYLMRDQFGNYVIQYLISLNLNDFNFRLLTIVSNDLVNLSCGKFSSNVVEKCLKLNNCNTIILTNLINIQTLILLIKDQYGNYVVQTALEIADWPIKCVIAEMIKPMLANIRYSNYGKRIYSKVIQILSKMDNKLELTNSNNQSTSTTAALLPAINFAD